MNGRKLLTLWDTGAFKSVMKSIKSCLKKLHTFPILHCAQRYIFYQLLAAKQYQKGKSFRPAFEKIKTYIDTMSNLRRSLIFGLDFHHKIRIGTNWNETGKLFLHKNGQIITHAIITPTALSKLESIKYRETPP